jgi:hypothetical protein
MCEEANGYYIGLGCSDDGTFSLQYFNDAYCLQPTGSTYDNLRQLNRSLKSYKSCTQLGQSNDDDSDNLAAMLVYTSDSCSSLDSSLCTDNSAMKSRLSHTSKSSHRMPSVSFSGKTWVTKLKYVAAGLLLLASFVMFTGILFTNRRRRRALMQRKYRQSKSRKGKTGSRSGARSKSKTRTPKEEKSSRRSKSRTRDEKEAEPSGVFT